MQPAIFLDRDGVIIENCPQYVRSWDDVIIFDQAISALVTISSFPYKLVIITNQSAVGRGIMPMNVAEDINLRLVRLIEKAGGRIDGVFMCPHSPEDACDCRKPKPGLLHQAAQELSIDLSKSILIGDAITDLQAGKAAGIHTKILVKTGRGAEQNFLAQNLDLGPYQVFETLAKALASIIDH
jgi:D-glycero-D-manno-heptose 1,7-bisphosphate phosphatase